MATLRFKQFPVYDDLGNVVLKHYDDIGSGGPQVAASYEVALDPEFNDIIDAIYFTTEHLVSWTTPLPRKGDPIGDYHTNEKTLYARGRIFCGIIPADFIIRQYATDQEVLDLCDACGSIFYSPWTDVAIGTQQYQEVIITEDDQEDIHINSELIDMKFNAKP